jgi:hypothetical protein
LGVLYKLLRGGGTSDVGFVGFDGKGLCMEKILHIFCNLEKHIISLRGESFRLDCNYVDATEDAFYN